MIINPYVIHKIIMDSDSWKENCKKDKTRKGNGNIMEVKRNLFGATNSFSNIETIDAVKNIKKNKTDVNCKKRFNIKFFSPLLFHRYY